MMALTMTEQVIVSPSLLKWDPSEFVYDPNFDLVIGKEWLSKYNFTLPGEFRLVDHTFKRITLNYK